MWYLTLPPALWMVLFLAGCGGTQEPIPTKVAAKAKVQSESAVDPVPTLSCDSTEIGPGGTATYTVTVTVPSSETERAEQVSVRFSTNDPLEIRAAEQPATIANVADSFVGGVHDSTALHYLRRTDLRDSVSISPEVREVVLQVGDMDPGQTVTCVVRVDWPPA